MATDWQVSEVGDTCRAAAGPGRRRSVQIEWLSAGTAHLEFPALLSVPHLLSREIMMNIRHLAALPSNPPECPHRVWSRNGQERCSDRLHDFIMQMVYLCDFVFPVLSASYFRRWHGRHLILTACKVSCPSVWFVCPSACSLVWIGFSESPHHSAWLKKGQVPLQVCLSHSPTLSRSLSVSESRKVLKITMQQLTHGHGSLSNLNLLSWWGLILPVCELWSSQRSRCFCSFSSFHFSLNRYACIWECVLVRICTCSMLYVIITR